MASIDYFFDEVKIKDPNNFEKELRSVLDQLYVLNSWVLSALVPKDSAGLYIIICHRLTELAA